MTVRAVEGIDPGMAEDHPAGFLVCTIDDNDVLEAIHEFLLFQGTAAEMAKHIHDTRALLGYRPAWTVIDPSARNKNHQTGRSIQDEYRKHGIFTLPGQNSRLASYNALTERLRTDRLRVWASCPDLIGQLENYRWKKPRRRGEDAVKEEPIKINDDLVDPLRYIAMQLPTVVKAREAEGPPDSGPVEAMRAHIRRQAKGRRAPRVGGTVAA